MDIWALGVVVTAVCGFRFTDVADEDEIQLAWMTYLGIPPNDTGFSIQPSQAANTTPKKELPHQLVSTLGDIGVDILTAFLMYTPLHRLTAAEALDFGTPGRLNSQYRPELISGEFTYSSESISPDNDGFEDVLQVNYQMAEVGMVGTFTVYDDRGRLIAQVMSSELLAIEGTFTWQGITDAGNKASIGTYVGVFEAFAVDGEASFAKRKAFVVAGQL